MSTRNFYATAPAVKRFHMKMTLKTMIQYAVVILNMLKQERSHRKFAESTGVKIDNQHDMEITLDSHGFNRYRSQCFLFL